MVSLLLITRGDIYYRTGNRMCMWMHAGSPDKQGGLVAAGHVQA